jgi:asparagine synthase (glutamine-hydrolysing)
MPGICGLIGGGTGEETIVAIRKMACAMTRGSGHETGVLFEKATGLVAGWAKTTGAFAECSPAWNGSKNISLLFTGEIFRNSDTTHHISPSGRSHLLIQQYEMEGIKCFENLNGWFAGLLIDYRKQKAILFNDRYGLARIYVYQTPDHTWFASEAKALLQALPQLRRIDPKGLGEWFSCGCVLQNRTLFTDISLLPSGSAWVFSAGCSVTKRKYFDPTSWNSQPRLSDADYYEKFKETFPRTLKRYVAGNERIGMSLTGGLDGRMIMAWAQPNRGELPCYTFNGSYRDCADVRIARKVAAACGQPHQTISVGDEFLAQFPQLAEQTVGVTDGAMDVSGAAELYVNRLAREIAPVRLTGNYGSEILRRHVAFKPRALSSQIFSPDFDPQIAAAARTYSEEAQGDRLSFIVFKQVPWHHYARFAVEQSQLSVRSPFLDNDLVAGAFQAPPQAATSLNPSLRLIVKGNPALGRIPTDRGISYPANRITSWMYRSVEKFLSKAEYAYDYGMPNWLARIDRFLAPFRFENLFLGHQKFYHFRIWYRRQLAGYVKQVLLDPRSRSRPYVNGAALEPLVNAHVTGLRNCTIEIHKLLSLELIHRTLLERS